MQTLLVLSSTTKLFAPPISAVSTRHKKPTTHSMPPEKVEIFKALEPWAAKHLLPCLKPVDQSWQPIDFLPSPSNRPSGEFLDEIQAIRERTLELPDEYFVVLVGDMITEEALPTYQSSLNMLDGVKDESGASSSPWAKWIRGWTAEENRHGDLLKTYLYLSGRVNMSAIERTIQYLIGSGMDLGFENNPYLAFVYTSIQERGTFIAHGNTARLAINSGDPTLARICGTIASDEKRHENAYIKIVEKLLEIDPNETMLAIGRMFRKRNEMPADKMYDGRDEHLSEHYMSVTEQIGVYTMDDYADNLEFLIGRWRLDKVEGLQGDGRREQEFVCRFVPKLRKWKEMRGKKVKSTGVSFSWIFDKQI